MFKLQIRNINLYRTNSLAQLERRITKYNNHIAMLKWNLAYPIIVR